MDEEAKFQWLRSWLDRHYVQNCENIPAPYKREDGWYERFGLILLALHDYELAANELAALKAGKEGKR